MFAEILGMLLFQFTTTGALNGFKGSFKMFSRAFVGNICGFYSPFLKHVLGYWNHRNYNNMYEDMKKNLPAVIKRVTNLLEKDLSESDISELENHLSFKNMKANAAVNKELFWRREGDDQSRERNIHEERRDW